MAADDWAWREALLDELLDLPEDARDAFIAKVERDDAGHAAALRDWLRGIERSDGYLATPVSAALGRHGEGVGNWRALRRIGRGGMGEVWLGERADGLFAKQVAIKFIRDDRPELARHIESERRVLATLQHPGIVRLLDAGTSADGHPFLVTDYIDGEPLDAWLAREKPGLERRLALLREIAAAIGYAHEHLVVHRDIKPANILVDAAGRTHLLDFGIAGALAFDGDAAQMTHVALTPEYAAPETIESGRTSVRSDVYSLGGLLYFLLAGKTPLPLAGLPLAAMIERIRDAQPAAPSRVAAARDRYASRALLADLDAIALKALAKNPADRYGSAEAFAADLDAARRRQPIAARAPGTLDRARRYVYRHRVALIVVGIVVASLVAGLAGTLWQAREARLQRDRAAAEAQRAEAKAKTAQAVRDLLVGMFDAANPEVSQGATPTAADLVETGARQAEETLRDQPEVQVELFDALAETEVGLGNYKRALELYKRGHDVATATFGEDSLQARTLAVHYVRTLGTTDNRDDDARRMIEHVVASAAKDPASAALQVEALIELSGVQRKAGELDAAQATLEHATAQARELGTNGTTVLVSALHQKAAWAVDKGRRDDGIALLREIIDLLQGQSSFSIGDLGRARAELASLLGEAGRNDEAEVMLRDLHASSLKVFGPDHPATLRAETDLARALMRKPDFAGAQALLDDALARTQSRFGDDSESTALARNTLAALKYAQHDFSGAIALLEQVTRYVNSKDGPDNWRALLMRQNLARLRVDAGDYARAEPALRALVADLARIGSGNDGDALSLLGNVRRYRGDAEGARDLHRRALESLARNGDTKSFDVQDFRLEVAEDERNLGHFDAAREQARAALDGLVALDQKANDMKIAYARFVLAQIDVLEKRCNADDLAAIQSLQTIHDEDRGEPVQPGLQWKIARIALFEGLCRRQIRHDDAQAQPLIVANAKRLQASTIADPAMRRLADDALHGRY